MARRKSSGEGAGAALRPQELDLRRIVEERGLSPDEWAVTHIRAKDWTQATRNGPVPCQHVSVELKPIIGPRMVDDVKQRLQKLAQRTRRTGVQQYERGRDLLLEIALSDAHIGAWSNGSVEEHTARIVATALALADEAQRAYGGRIAQCLLLANGDIMHADSIRGETTKGTRLEDVGAPYQRLLRETLAMFVALINNLEQRWRVHLEVVPGNHDFHSLVAVGEALRLFYEKDYNGVTVSAGTEKFRYYRWGTVLLGFCHGDTGQLKDLPSLMANDRPRDWGETTHHEWHTGHHHAQAQFERGGARMRVLPALTGRNQWSRNRGYGETGKGAEAYVWSRDRGYVGHMHQAPVIPMPEERRAA